jgi:NAD(P)H-dependent FMN reductase
MLNLKIIIGSTRPGRAADAVVPWITTKARDHHDHFDVDVVDLAGWELPMFAETLATVGDPLNPTFSHPVVKEWNQTIAAGDAYLFVTPEYNHSIPAALKNALDSVFATFAFRHKPAGIVAYSGWGSGGVRAAEHLTAIAVEMEMIPMRNVVTIPNVTVAFDDDHQPTNHHLDRVAEILLEDLAWFGATMSAARAEGAPPPAIHRLHAMTASAR